MKPLYLALMLFVLAIAMWYANPKHENFNRYTTLPYPNMCEYNEECAWDVARTVQMSNGMEGNCTLHGIACPSFSKDNVSSRNFGLSPTMVDNDYYSSILRQNPFIGSNKNSALSNTWGINPPIINHYNRRGGLVYNNALNEYFDGNTAMGLGMFPTSSG